MYVYIYMSIYISYNDVLSQSRSNQKAGDEMSHEVTRQQNSNEQRLAEDDSFHQSRKSQPLYL